MTFILTEEQQLFGDSARKFLQARAPVAALRRLRDSRDPIGFSRELWAEVASMGWAGVLVPEDYGGVGFGHVGAGLIAEGSGRTLTALPLLSTAVLGVTIVLRGGSGEQKSELLPAIAAGKLVTALAIDERSRHAPGGVATRAVATGSGFRLKGKKTFVLDGHVADRLIVSARVEGATTLFLVDPRVRGVTVERTIMVDTRNAADVHLKDVEVSRADVIGTVGTGASLLERALDAGRAVLAAELVGLATECLERTLDYLRQREQFGRKVGEFQALQHRAAHLFCEIELARSAVATALRALDADADNVSLLVSVAKAKSGEAAKLATNEALQMHGGIGMTDEFDIGFFMKRARAAAETFGDYAFHGDRVARHYGF
ncbi:MAG: acyl-CoA dehydrogenase family protein [Steroidobacteraceae bacterium]